MYCQYEVARLVGTWLGFEDLEYMLQLGMSGDTMVTRRKSIFFNTCTLSYLNELCVLC